MVAINVNTLLCLPADLYDDLSVEGVELRLDDHLLATGQQIVCTADAVAGATSLSVTALSFPLLTGSTLQFDCGGITVLGGVQLTSVAPVGSTALPVASLTAAIPSGATAWDNGNNLRTAQLLLKACQYGSSQVADYCCPRYDITELARSPSCNRWATCLAKRWLCRRCARPIPQAVVDEAKEVLEELKAVRSSHLHINGAGTRTSGWPFLTNVTLDIGYQVARTRVQPSISEGTPVKYPQYVDWNSVLFFDY